MGSDDHAAGVDQLYAQLAAPLRRIVAANLTVSEDLLDDACQCAWSRLLSSPAPITPGTELAWLTTTATREALRLIRAQRRTVSFGAAPEHDDSARSYRSRPPEPQQLAELHDRLGSLSRLPLRQRKIVWLHGLGYGYGEISAVTGASRRTVERQLLGARRKLVG